MSNSGHSYREPCRSLSDVSAFYFLSEAGNALIVAEVGGKWTAVTFYKIHGLNPDFSGKAFLSSGGHKAHLIIHSLSRYVVLQVLFITS